MIKVLTKGFGKHQNHTSQVVRGAGLGSRGASCKRHEMSSIKNVWGGVG